MPARVLQFSILFFTIVGLVYVATRDFPDRIEADVSSLLPEDESPSAQILRSLISNRQGRVVYLAVTTGGGDLEMRERLAERVFEMWSAHPVIRSIEPYGEDSSFAFLGYASQRRLELFLPKWFERKRAEYESSNTDESFREWVSESVIQDLNTFFESPMALELGREELVDPLLLVVNALLTLSERESVAPRAETDGPKLFWVELSDSPLLPETQDVLAGLVAETRAELAGAAELEYGGLARLAAASRSRIQTDIGKVNGLSLAFVVVISLVLVRPPWKIALALPVVACSLIGAMAGSFLVFEKVNVVVIIIGSVLIGTSIDYAFHTLFAESGKSALPTRKLLLIACGSTVVGFGVLVLAEMVLIRQIGVFAGFGLLSAYMASLALPRGQERAANAAALDRWRLPKPVAGVAALVVALGTVGLFVLEDGIHWSEDVRNLEAPDPAAVEADLALRAAFGFESGGQLVFSQGADFLSALGSQARFLQRLDEAGLVDSQRFAPSEILPSAAEVEALESNRAVLAEALGAIELRLEEEGYDAPAFAGFFESARAFAAEATLPAVESVVEELADRMTGPLSLLVGSGEGRAWAVASVGSGTEVADIAKDDGDAILLSQLTLLNESLDALRSRIGFFGTIGMTAVAIAVLVLLGVRHGLLVLTIPALAVAFSLAVSGSFFGPLNLFHLIGCFLGGAIALDYAIFSMESRRRGLPIPFSVWLSSATTGASFVALTTSYIAGVRALGVIVAMVTLVSVALIVCCYGLLTTGQEVADEDG